MAIPLVAARAPARLGRAGFDVLRVDDNQRSAEQSAAFIRNRLLSFGASSNE